MYNPNNFELPEFDDPRLTEYLHTSEFDLVQVIAFKSDVYGDFIPETAFETSGPYEGATDFHWISEDGSEAEPVISMYGPLEGKSEVFDVEQLDPLDTDFDKVRSFVHALIGEPEPDIESDAEMIGGWYEQASQGEFDKVRIFRERYGQEWIIRAWEGLTLDDLKTDGFHGPGYFVNYMSYDESNYQSSGEECLDTRLLETLNCGPGLQRLQLRTESESDEDSLAEPKQGLWAVVKGFFKK